MPALNFLITNAGKSAIATAIATGNTIPVTISKVAIGSSGYTATGAQTALVAPIKQITPQGSSVPTPGTIHITASDSSADSYTVREVGLITSTGTLFAIYSQADPILVKGSGSVALFALDFVMTGVPAGSVTIGSASFQYPPATETAQGVAEIATQAETDAGTDNARFITPLKLAQRLATWLGFTPVQQGGGSNQGANKVRIGWASTGDGLLAQVDAVPIGTLLTTGSGGAGKEGVLRTGDTMTGHLTLVGSPSSGLHPATKSYTDAADALKLNKDGDTMTGPLTLPADPTAALHAATKQYIDGLLLGMITTFPQTTEPTGWLKCNGQAVSRTTYASLFAKVGTTYGVGNGSTTFNVPDLRGEFIRGLDEGRAADTGRVLGSAQADMLEAHNHNVGAFTTSASNTGQGVFNFYAVTSHGGGSSFNGYTTSSNGGTETRPRNVAFPFFIKF
jgi:microcystin-dependent protein